MQSRLVSLMNLRLHITQLCTDFGNRRTQSMHDLIARPDPTDAVLSGDFLLG